MRQIQIQDRGIHNNTFRQREIQTCQQIYSQIYRRIHLQIYRQIYKRIYGQIYRWICKLAFKSGQDLELHKSLLWCHFNFRLRPQLEERSPWSGCHQINVHLWEELVSEGGFHKAPNMWLVSYPLNLQPGESLGVHTAIYKSTRIYKNLHRSTRLTTSQDIHPYIWRVSNTRGTVFITFPQMFAAISRQCSYTRSTQPCQWAIRLHHHSMKREQPLWGNSLLTVPKVWLILQFQQLQQDQHNSNNKWHCITVHPTMCIIVWPLEPSEEGLLWSVQWIVVIMKWLFCFRQLTVWKSNQGFSYGAVCVKLTNHGSFGSVGLTSSFITPIVWTDEWKDISSIHHL